MNSGKMPSELSKKAADALKSNLLNLKTLIQRLDLILQEMLLNYEEKVELGSWLPPSYRLRGRTSYDYQSLQDIKKKLLKKFKSGSKIQEKDLLLLRRRSEELDLTSDSDRKIIDGIRVGRSAKGNQKLFKDTKLSERQRGFKHLYLHSSVRGGSLVILRAEPSKQDFERGLTLALAYSKNFRTLGTGSGYVDYSEVVTEGPQLGSFYFKESKTNYHYPLPLYLHLEPRIKVSFEPSPYRLNAGGQRANLRSILKSIRVRGLRLSEKSITEIQSRVPQDWNHLIFDRPPG